MPVNVGSDIKFISTMTDTLIGQARWLSKALRAKAIMDLYTF